MEKIICYIFLGAIALVIIYGIIDGFHNAELKQKNVQSARIKYEDEIYEFRFWNEYDFAEWTCAGVYKVLSPKIKKGKEIPQYDCIDSTRWATDRVEWCWEALARYVNSVKLEQQDLKKVAEFCSEAEV